MMLIHREVLTGILCSICPTQTNRGKPGERDTPAQQSLPLHAPTWRRHVPVLASLRAGAQSPLGTSREPQKSENGPIIVWTILARTRYLLSQLVSDPEPQEPLVGPRPQGGDAVGAEGPGQTRNRTQAQVRKHSGFGLI